MASALAEATSSVSKSRLAPKLNGCSEIRIGSRSAHRPDLVTKEIDPALTDGRCDLAVHCMKDVPGDRPVPTGTVFAVYLARDDIRDA